MGAGQSTIELDDIALSLDAGSSPQPLSKKSPEPPVTTHPLPEKPSPLQLPTKTAQLINEAQKIERTEAPVHVAAAPVKSEPPKRPLESTITSTIPEQHKDQSKKEKESKVKQPAPAKEAP